MLEIIKKNKLTSIISIAVLFLVVTVFLPSQYIARASTNDLAAVASTPIKVNDVTGSNVAGSGNQASGAIVGGVVGGVVEAKVEGSFSFLLSVDLRVYKYLFSINRKEYFVDLNQMEVTSSDGTSMPDSSVVKIGNLVTVKFVSNPDATPPGDYIVDVFSTVTALDGTILQSNRPLSIPKVNMKVVESVKIAPVSAGTDWVVTFPTRAMNAIRTLPAQIMGFFSKIFGWQIGVGVEQQGAQQQGQQGQGIQQIKDSGSGGVGSVDVK